MTSSLVLLLGWLRASGCLRWLSRWRMLYGQCWSGTVLPLLGSTCVPTPPAAVTTVVEVEPAAVEATTISEEVEVDTPIPVW